MHDLDTFLTNKKNKKRRRNGVRKVKKVVRIRWMSLYASVYREYVRLLQILNLLVEEKGSGGAMKKGFAKKLKSFNFLEMLYTIH